MAILLKAANAINDSMLQHFQKDFHRATAL